jgi:hypothetical protein
MAQLIFFWRNLNLPQVAAHLGCGSRNLSLPQPKFAATPTNSRTLPQLAATGLKFRGHRWSLPLVTSNLFPVTARG